MLDQKMEKGKNLFLNLNILKIEVNNFNTIDATPAFIRDDFKYLKKSHKTLLLFRRTSKDGNLELRHQRTGDVVFDWKSKCV